MVKSRDHFDRTPSNVVWIAQMMLLEPCQWLDLVFQQIDTRAFHRLASLSKPVLVWTLRDRITRTSRFAFRQRIVHD